MKQFYHFSIFNVLSSLIWLQFVNIISFVNTVIALFLSVEYSRSVWVTLCVWWHCFLLIHENNTMWLLATALFLYVVDYELLFFS